MDRIVTEYLPRAFAFIYTINSSNAGGIQKDRVSNEWLWTKILPFLYLVTSLTFMSLDTKTILCVKHVLVVDRSQTHNILLITIQRVRQTPSSYSHARLRTLMLIVYAQTTCAGNATTVCHVLVTVDLSLRETSNNTLKTNHSQGEWKI